MTLPRCRGPTTRQKDSSGNDRGRHIGSVACRSERSHRPAKVPTRPARPCAERRFAPRRRAARAIPADGSKALVSFGDGSGQDRARAPSREVGRSLRSAGARQRVMASFRSSDAVRLAAVPIAPLGERQPVFARELRRELDGSPESRRRRSRRMDGPVSCGHAGPSSCGSRRVSPLARPARDRLDRQELRLFVLLGRQERTSSLATERHQPVSSLIDHRLPCQLVEQILERDQPNVSRAPATRTVSSPTRQLPR